MNLNYYRAIQNVIDAVSEKDAIANEAKYRLIDDLQNSINYVPDSTRNGISQRFVVTPSPTKCKCKIEAFPDEELYVGDLIECYNEKWIVIETSVINPIQTTGIMWLCNFELQYQNNNSEILSQSCVLDSGVYSTTVTKDTEVQTVNKQFKLYLPYNDDTKKIYIDKRIATDVKYDKYGKEILEVFKITGTNRVARSYGTGAHLLICELRSDVQNENDNLSKMICDYIEPVFENDNPAHFRIDGRKTIPLGSTRNYKIKNNEQNEESEENNELNSMFKPNWTVETDIGDLEIVCADNDFTISVPDNEKYVGKKIKIIAIDDNQSFPSIAFEVEVVAI